jgi:hypothetical protein
MSLVKPEEYPSVCSFIRFSAVSQSVPMSFSMVKLDLRFSHTFADGACMSPGGVVAVIAGAIDVILSCYNTYLAQAFGVVAHAINAWFEIDLIREEVGSDSICLRGIFQAPLCSTYSPFTYSDLALNRRMTFYRR